MYKSILLILSVWTILSLPAPPKKPKSKVTPRKGNTKVVSTPAASQRYIIEIPYNHDLEIETNVELPTGGRWRAINGKMSEDGKTYSAPESFLPDDMDIITYIAPANSNIKIQMKIKLVRPEKTNAENPTKRYGTPLVDIAAYNRQAAKVSRAQSTTKSKLNLRFKQNLRHGFWLPCFSSSSSIVLYTPQFDRVINPDAKPRPKKPLVVCRETSNKVTE